MKKNVLRILLALVLVAFVFAFAACGGSGNKTDNPPTPVAHEHKDENNDGKCDICKQTMEAQVDPNKRDLTAELTNLLKSLDPYLTSFKSTDADSSLGLDLGVGGYFENTDKEGKKTDGNFSLKVAANARKEAPELKLGVSVNKKEYFVIGYKEKALYLLEGLNIINSGNKNTAATAVKMDATYLADSIDYAAGVGMEYVSWLAGSDMLKNLSLTDLANQLSKMLGIVANLIDCSIDPNDEKVILFTVGSNAVSTVLGLLPESIVPTVNTVLGYVGGFLSLDSELTLETLPTDFEPSLVIKGKYDSADAATRKLEGIDVAIKLGGKLNLEAGLSIDINTLSLDEEANITFGSNYKAKDLNSQVTVDLPLKGAYGKLDLQVNTSNAFANETNNVASATFEVRTDDSAKLAAPYVKLAEAAFDGKTIYLGFDYSKVSSLGVTMGEDSIPDVTKFAYVIKVGQRDDDGKLVVDKDGKPVYVAKNIKTMLKEALESLKYEEPETESGANNAAADEGESEGLIDGLISKFVNPAILFINGKFKDYIKFDLVDDSGDVLPVMDIVNQVVEIFGKPGVKDSILNAVKAEGTEAGIQLIAPDNGDSLLKFLSNFIRVPKVNADKNGIITSGTDEERYAEVSDVNAIIDYLDWLFNHFELTEDDFTSVAGIKYSDLLKEGVYAFAGYNAKQSLSGYIGLRADDKSTSDVYVKINARIGFDTYTSNNANMPAAADLATMAAFGDEDGMSDDLSENLFALLGALQNYEKTQPEQQQ